MRILLHAGHFKTGTTAFQQRLFGSRAALARAGVEVPAAPRSNHGYILNPRHPQRFQQASVGLLDAIRQAEGDGLHTVVLSAELLAQLSDKELLPLRDLLSAWPVEVLLVLRPWRDFLPSRYAQLIHAGEWMGLADWLADLEACGLEHPDANFALPIERLGRVWNTLHLAAYAPDRAWSLICQLAQIPNAIANAAQPRQANPRMSWPQREAVRFVNAVIGPIQGGAMGAKHRQGYAGHSWQPLRLTGRELLARAESAGAPWVGQLTDYVRKYAEPIELRAVQEPVRHWNQRLQHALADLPPSCRHGDFTGFADFAGAQQEWSLPADLLCAAGGQRLRAHILDAWATYCREQTPR